MCSSSSNNFTHISLCHIHYNSIISGISLFIVKAKTKTSQISSSTPNQFQPFLPSPRGTDLSPQSEEFDELALTISPACADILSKMSNPKMCYMHVKIIQ
ncbi:hypothetical protein ILYODFUR_022983 [Ilyodon furcidens]|uniref:Uncharacterized protein n=1 Tax=Ilyodon furcidens TaxID=33524 RepID=A0ABV0TBP8_9TELE